MKIDVPIRKSITNKRNLRHLSFLFASGMLLLLFASPPARAAYPLDADNILWTKPPNEPQAPLYLLPFWNYTNQEVILTDCDNVTDPGKIGFNQTLCAPGNDPEPFVNLESASGGSGALEYFWMKSESSAIFSTTGFKIIPGANEATYDAGPVFITTYFARCVRRAGCEKFLEANIITVEVADNAIATIVADSAVCFSEETSISVQTKTNNARIQWEFPEGVVGDNDDERVVNISFAGHGKYTLKVTVTENGCTTIGTKDIYAINSYVFCDPDNPNCGEAAFEAPDTLCGNFGLQLINQSTRANRFVWNITGPDTDIVSTQRSPFITFPGNGIYTIELIIDPNTSCTDRVSKTIVVDNNALRTDCIISVVECEDSAYVFLEGIADSRFNVTDWEWTVRLSNGDSMLISGQNTQFAISFEREGSIELVARTEEGCNGSIISSFRIGDGFPIENLVDTLQACIGQSIALNPLGVSDGLFTYQWEGPGIDDPTEINPIVVVPDGTSTYEVSVIGKDSVCVINHTLTLIGNSRVDLDLAIQTTCEGLGYRFINQTNSDTEVKWTIGDFSAPIFTSEADTFEFTFDQEGVYAIHLIDQLGCGDTLTQLLAVQNFELEVAFDYEYTDCDAGEVQVKLVDRSASTDPINKWTWELSDGRSAMEEAPDFTFTESDSVEVKLTVETQSGCTATSTRTIGINLLEDVIQRIPDTLGICNGVSRQLIPENDPKYQYVWSPANGLDENDTPNPIFSEPGSYTVVISLPGSMTCSVEKQVVAILPDAINLSIEGGGTSCEQSLTLNAQTDSEANIDWYLNDQLLVSNRSELIATEMGDNTYTAIATDRFGCSDTAQVQVNLIGVDLEVPEQVSVCEGETIRVSVSNLDPNDQVSYTWAPAELIVSGQGTPEVIIDAPIGGQFLTLTTENQNDCERTDRIQVIVVDSTFNLDFEVEPQCLGTLVNFKNTSENAFGYFWDFGDPANPNSTSTEEDPFYTYSAPGEYTVSLTLQYDVSCADTLRKTITVDSLDNFAVDFAVELIDCQPGAVTLRFTDLTRSPDSNLVYEYIFSNGIRRSEPNFDITLTEFGSLGVTLNVLAEGSCSGTLSKFVQVPVVDVDLPDTLVLCDPPSIVLNDGGRTEYEYQWEPAPGISDLTAASPTVTPTETTTYTVTITAIGIDTCSIVDQVVVKVPESRLEINLPDEVIACGASILTVDLPDADQLRWENSEGEVIGNGPSVEVTPFKEATYFLIATDENGCDYIDSTRVINQGPNISIDPGNNIDVCQGEAFTLTANNLDSEDTLSYQWLPTSFIQGANTNSSADFLIEDSGTYTIQAIVSNQLNCSDTIDIEVNVGNLNSGLPDTVLVCGETEKELGPNSDPDLSYQWSPATGLSDATSNNPIFSGTENTTYIVTVTNPVVGGDCQVIDTVVVQIGSSVSIEKAPHPDTVCVGESLDLSVSTMGDGQIDWYQGENFQDLNNNDSLLTVSIAQGENLYYAVISEGAGCSDTARFEITGITIEDLGLESQLEGCIGATFMLLPDANPGFSYQWTPAEFLVDASAPNPTTIPLREDITFTVKVTEPFTGCTLEGVIMIDIKNDLLLSVSNDTTVCPLSDLTFEAIASSGAAFEWQDENGNFITDESSIEVEAGNEDTFVIAVASDANCTQRDTVFIDVQEINSGIEGAVEVCRDVPTAINPNGDPNLVYTWTPETGLDLSDPSNPVATLDADQVYQVLVQDTTTGCSIDTSLEVRVLENIRILETSNDTMLCSIVPVILSASTNIPDTLRWFSDVAMTQEIGSGNTIEVLPEMGNNFYYVKTSDEDCVDGEDVDTIRVMVLDFANMALPDPVTEVCQDIPTPINPGSNPNYIYTWTPETGLDLSDPSNPVATLDADQSYRVMVVDTVTGCSLDTTLDITVLENPSIITTTNDTTLCAIEEITLMATTNIPANLEWFADAEMTQSLGTGNSIQVTPQEGSNTYYVKTDDENCVDSRDVDTVNVEVIDFPSLALPNPVTEVCQGIPTPINPGGNPAYQYTWTPETGLDLSDPSNPVATLDADQSYRVMVVDTVTGCSIDTTLDITVLENPSIVTTTNDTTLCAIEEITLMATTNIPANLEWFADAEMTQSLGTGNSIQVTPQEGLNTYFVKTDDENCVDSRDVDTVNVEVIDFPSMALPNPVTEVCQGIPTPINPGGNPAYQYTWTPETGLDLSDTSNPVATLDADQSYRMMVVDPVTGCSLDTTLDITVLENPSIVTTTNDTTLCAIEEITLMATTNIPANLEWFADAEMTQSLGTGNSIQVTPQEGLNTYFVKTDDENCVDSRDVDTVNVEVIDFPSMALPNPVTEVCQGIPTPINPGGNPAYQYTWTPETGLDLSDTSNPVATLDADQSYRVMVVDPVTGCSLDTTLDITVLENPSIVTTTNDTTLCAIEEITLMATTNIPANLEWFADAEMTQSLGTGNSIQVTPQEGSNTYFVKTDDENCVDSRDVDTVNVEVIDFPSMALPNLVTEVCQGIPTPINPGGNPAYQYTWTPETGLDLSDPSNPVATLDADQSYRVMVVDTVTGCSLDTTLDITVLENPSIVTTTNDTTLCAIEEITLMATTNIPANLEWFADAEMTQSLGTGNSIQVTPQEGSNTYYVKTDDENCVDSRDVDTVNVEVIDFPSLALPNPVTEFCQGIPTPINPGGNPAYQYTWTPETGLDLSDTSNPVATLDADQSYRVMVVDTVTGCSLDTMLDISLLQNPSIVMASNDTMLCDPSELTLVASTNGIGNLEWFADAEMTQSLGMGDTLRITPSVGMNTYYVKTDDEVCVDNNDVDTVMVGVADFSGVTPDSVQTVCRGDLVQLNSRGDDRYFYEWTLAEGLSDPNSPNPSFIANEPQQFIVKITDPDSMCTITRTVDIELDNPINLDAGVDTVLCEPGTFKLRASSEGGGGFMWATDREFNNIISMDIEAEIDLVEGGQYYYVKGGNGDACTEVDSVFVGTGMINAFLPETTLACDATTGAVLEVTNQKPEQELDYLWEPASKLSSDQTEGPQATLNPGADGLVQVFLENQFGCTAELSTVVEIQDVGSATIEASDTVILPGNPVQIMVNDCEDCEYQWEPADGVDNPTSSMVTVVPLETTTYTVTITKGDCERVLSITIMTEGTPCTTENIFIPRAFTPNGDGDNDVLFVRSNVIDELRFIVFNRWGQEVFDAKDIDQGWDGTFRGNDLPPDVYGYFLEATCIDGNSIRLQGNVTLLR